MSEEGVEDGIEAAVDEGQTEGDISYHVTCIHLKIDALDLEEVEDMEWEPADEEAHHHRYHHARHLASFPVRLRHQQQYVINDKVHSGHPRQILDLNEVVAQWCTFKMLNRNKNSRRGLKKLKRN